MTFRVMRTVGRERTISRSFHHSYLRITFFHTRKHGVEVIDLNAHVVDTSRIPRRPSKKSETDISIAHDDSSLVRSDNPFRSQDRSAEHFGMKLVRSLRLRR